MNPSAGPLERLAREHPFLVTFIALFLATLMRAALTPLWGPAYTFITYYPVIMLGTVLGGYRHGMLATVLSGLLSYFLFFGTRLPMDQAVALIVFLSVNVVMIAIVETVSRFRYRADMEAAAARGREEAVRRELDVRLGAEEELRASRLAALNLMEDALEARRNVEQATASLLESQARLRLAAEAADAGLWDRNLLTSTDYFSPECKRQIGYGDDELANRWEEWEKLLHPEDIEHVRTVTQDFIAGRQPSFELEFRLRHKDGSYRWIHSRGSLLRDKENRPYRMLGMNFDITEHKKSREMRARRAEMEESFRLYIATQTAAAIAHELNQPLAAIASYSEVALLLLQAGKPDLERLAHTLESIERQAQRAGKVTRQLLDLLQKSEIVSEPVNLNTTIQEAGALFQADNELDGFKLVLEFTPDLACVQANRLQVEKVIINLLRNGLEAMRDAGMRNGALTVATGALIDQSMARVTVSDSGKGVDEKNRKLIFQPFHTTKKRGLGMGLAVSRSLIEAHGGKLWLDPDTSAGARFHFTLPFANEH